MILCVLLWEDLLDFLLKFSFCPAPQDKVNSIKQDLKTNQANEATLTKEINDLTSAKEAANQNVTKTKTALDNAKTTDKTRANNIASQKTIVAQTKEIKIMLLQQKKQKLLKKKN